MSLQCFELAHCLRVTFTTKRVKMCHRRDMLIMFLLYKKFIFHSKDNQVFVFLIILLFTKSLMPQILVHEIGCTFEYIF